MSTRKYVGVALIFSAALFCATPALAAAAVDTGDATSTTPAPVVATDEPQVEKVCDDLDSTKINVSGSNPMLEISAPEGFVITEYCVKAGSVQQGNGPEYVTVDPPTRTVIIEHPSGKDISHYSYSYEPEPTTPPTTPPAHDSAGDDSAGDDAGRRHPVDTADEGSTRGDRIRHHLAADRGSRCGCPRIDRHR